ncbi:MAG TPA: MFS transporter [Candidatus Saccharimonadales bacterium]|nr:MFS transporter [Candidatus Saccharimonadales bacterium]
MHQYRQALAVRGYRRMWAAALVSRAGDAINFVALPLYVFGVTGSAVAVSALVLAEGVGLIVGGVAAQLVVDRVPPRRLLIAADVARAVVAILLALDASFPLAVAVSFLLAAGTAVFNPVSSALVPRLVRDDTLPAANTLTWTAGVVPQLVAAPLGGLLVAAASARAAFAVNAVSFAGSALILAAIPRMAPASTSATPWRQLPEIGRAVREVPVLRPLLTVQALAALSAGATSALLVVLARTAYGLGPTGYGLWLAVIGSGAVVGPLVVARLLRPAPWKTVSGAYMIRGAGDIGLGLLSQSVAGGGLLAIYAVNTSTGMIAYQTLVQRSVPLRVRGRSFALLDMVWQVGRLVSVAIGGVIAAAAGIRVVYVIGGVLLIAAGALGTATLRHVADNGGPRSEKPSTHGQSM